MNVRNVVKVMNFHSLLRVDKAKKTADKYRYMEDQLLMMIDTIMNNRNLILDKKLMVPDENAPELNIYLGSDFGFCSNFNSQIAEQLSRDEGSDKILIGKKLSGQRDGILFRMDNDEFQKDRSQVQKTIVDAVEQMTYSRINLVYNQYVNTTTIRLTKQQVFPVVIDAEEERQHKEDFVVEGDLNSLLRNLVITYVNYQVMLAQVSSSASENIMRQNATTESLKRIDELEEEKRMEALRERRSKEFQKVVDSFVKMKSQQA